MDRVEYLVCRRDGRWTLVHDGRETGHYDTREVAVSVGIDAANGAGLQGAEAVVSEEVTGGAPRTVWTYGRDPYEGPLKERSSPEFR
jgi:hypothetical protein